jgi:two-component system chemotaxis response regulator CheB
MARIRLLIVDDSFLVQEVLKEMLATDGDIEVIGAASNGKEGVEMALALKPDFITMDINMPVMNGLEAIEKIMAECSVPILVVSSINDAKVAFAACARGAMDVFPKTEVDPEKASKLIDKIKLLATVQVIGHTKVEEAPPPPVEVKPAFGHVVAFACSTGGPRALSLILPQLPKDFKYPILIAQHIEDGFLSGLVQWLRQISPLPVNEGLGNTAIQGGNIYVSPSEKHMVVDSQGKIGFVDRKPTDRYRPSCDQLFTSLASSFGKHAVGVILSGMAQDGVNGMKEIKAKGGVTVAQDEKSSAVFGMNNLAIKSGCVDKILPLKEIGKFLAGL